MKTPTQALIWELWRTSRLEFLGRISGLSGLIVLFYIAAFRQTANEASLDVIRGIVLMLLMIISLFSSTWLSNVDSRQVGFCFRLGFTRPISTAMLVLVPMLYAMATAVVCLLVPAMLFRILFGAYLPFLGPAVVVSGLTACFVAGTWSPTTRPGKILGIAASVISVFGLAYAFHLKSGDPDPILLVLGKPAIYDFAWHQYLVWMAVTLVACLVTVRAVDRQRHMGNVPPKRGIRWLERGQQPAQDRKPFSGPLSAQYWYEFRKIGPNMLLTGTLLPLIMFAVISVGQWCNPNWQYGAVVWLFVLIMCPLLYQFIGIDSAIGLRVQQGAVQYSVFDATRPLRADQLVMIKLAVIAGCSILGWLMMAAAAGTQAVISNDIEAWRRISQLLTEQLGTIRLSWWLAGGCSLLLMYLSSSSMLLAFGLWLPLHGRLFLGLSAFGYAHMILAFTDYKAMDWSLRLYWITCGWVLSVLIPLACGFVLKKSMLSGLLGRRFFCAICCLWAIHVGMTVALYFQVMDRIPDSVPAAGIAFGAAMLLVPLATTALAPLALASHRHN